VFFFVGPVFGFRLTGVGVYDHCDTHSDSYTSNFGSRYINDTGLCGKTLFAGSEHFIMKEIEVFETRDATILPYKRIRFAYPKSAFRNKISLVAPALFFPV
jgi:hypothetical protein